MSHLFLVGWLALSSAFAAEIPAAETTVAVVDHSAEWDVYLREQRQLQIERLQAYAEAGVFPINTSEAEFSHQFLDGRGNPCAVAYLIRESGGRGLVAATARTQNDVVVSDVSTGPLADWILSSGLIREEVAVIQLPAPRKPTAQVDTAAFEEQARVRTRLAAVIAVLQQDTESSMWKAKLRLGDKLNEAPPSQNTL